MPGSRERIVFCMLWVVLLLLFSSTQAASADEGTTTSASGLPFSSAVQIAATQSLGLKKLFTDVPAIPIPNNITKLPQYEVVKKLAAAPPLIQQMKAITLPKADVLIAEKLAELGKHHDPPAELASRASTLRVMIGDITWRYRIWQWFQQQNVNVQFVGPYTGTFQSTTALATGQQPPTQPPPLYSSTPPASNPESVSANGGYATTVDSAFLSAGGYNHFANWGRALAIDQGLIQTVLSNNMADLILLELGFNDMGWYYSDCYGTIGSMNDFVKNARAANPNIKIAAANVPQRIFIRSDLVSNITTYNQLLPGALNTLSTSQSPVIMVDFEGNYACGTTSCPAGYDGLHPNAWDEYQIANAFSKALIAQFGIGSTPLPIPAQNDPSIIRNIGTPQNFQVFSSPQGVSATWDPVYGAYSYDVSVSINGGGGGWSNGTVSVNRFDSQWPLQGWSYAVGVAAACGDQVGPSTSTQTAIAQPQLAPAPNNVRVQPTSDGFTISWDPPTGPYSSGIVEYNIIYWDTTPSACQFLSGAAFKSSPATITGLTVGGNYLVAPVTWNANGQGLPFIAHDVIPGGITPGTPSGLKVNSNDPTSVYISWNAVNGAAGYEVFWRNATGGPYRSLENTSETCTNTYFLYPGTWHYQFGVAAYNGNLESPQGPGIIAPSPASTVTEGSPGPTCPAAPPWCPGFSASYSGPYVGGTAGAGASGGGGGSSPTTTSKPSTTSKQTTTSSKKTTASPSACKTTKTVVSGKPMIECGTSTYSDPSPSQFSFQAQVTGNILYGTEHPTDLVSTISNQCTNGCNGALATSSLTGYYHTTSCAYPDTVELFIPYEVTNQAVPDADYATFLNAISTVAKGATTADSFLWYEGNPRGYCGHIPYNTTNYYGPSFVQGVRWELDTEPGGTGAYTIQSGQFSYAVTSHTETSSISCGDIEGPVAAALGSIPDVGTILGFIGALICALIDASGSR